jgi:hypothetical protein
MGNCGWKLGKGIGVAPAYEHCVRDGMVLSRFFVGGKNGKENVARSIRKE